MRWPVKEKSPYDDIKRKFALFPTKVHDEWLWLEFYYEYTELTNCGWEAYVRFLTYEGACKWLDKYRE
jgi:hypothetical protein